MNLKEKTMKNKNLKRNKITMKEVKKQVKGITLIALVVTIMIWEETCSNTLLRATLTSTVPTSFEEAITTATTTSIQQVAVTATLALPSATLVSVSLCIVVLKAKAAVSKL